MSNRNAKRKTSPANSARRSANARTGWGRASHTTGKPTRSRRPVVFGVIAAAVFVVAVVLVLSNRSASPTVASSGSGTSVAAQGGGSTAAAPAEEQKYIGRYLAAGYQAPQAQPVTYSGVTQMTDIAADASGSKLSVALADVATNKIVYFTYAKPTGESIPMLAYVKPSGAVFVGVSYCIPCKGQRQYIDADGTLTCNSCGTKRDLTTGVGLSGACRLYPLDEVPASISGDKLVVEKTVLDQWTPQPSDRPVG